MQPLLPLFINGTLLLTVNIEATTGNTLHVDRASLVWLVLCQLTVRKATAVRLEAETVQRSVNSSALIKSPGFDVYHHIHGVICYVIIPPYKCRPWLQHHWTRLR